MGTRNGVCAKVKATSRPVGCEKGRYKTADEIVQKHYVYTLEQTQI
jgi:hypothetical protein